MLDMDSTDDFQDPFSYRPLKRKKIVKNGNLKNKTANKQPTQSARKAPNTRNNNIKSPAKTVSKSPAKSVLKSPAKTVSKSPAKSVLNSPAKTVLKSPAKKKTSPGKIISPYTSPSKQTILDSFWGRKTELIENNNESDQHCPICQVPLRVLDKSILQDHVKCCEELPDSASDCPDGLKCQSLFASHFSQFRHVLLAQHREMGAFTRTTQILEFSQASDFQSGEFPPLQREIIAPTPCFNSTPVDGRPFSPIQKLGENNCLLTDNDSPPSEAGSRKLSTSHVRQFLQNMDSGGRKSQGEDNQSILRGGYSSPRGTAPPRRVESVTGTSQVAGPSNGRPNANQISGGNGHTTGGGGDLANNSVAQSNDPFEHTSKGTPIDLDSDDHENDASSKVPAANVNNKRTDNLKVRCTRDSSEFEVTVHQEDNRTLSVRVPVKQKKFEVTAKCGGGTDSDGSSPISPSKQSRITSYFASKQGRREKENLNLETADELDIRGDYVYAKRTKYDEAVNQWNKIFKKPAAPPPPRQTSANATRHQNGSQVRSPSEERKRKLPWFKIVKDTTFAVDAFNWGQISGVLTYFLTHYHYDHYQGITKHWSKPIVCSSLTKRCLLAYVKVNEKLITTIDPGQERVIDQVQISCIDANHCPGAVMFVFRLTTGKTILHVGDFRADPSMESESVFWNNRRIDTVYLDTTYCDPAYDFPPQHDVIQFAKEKALEMSEKYPKLVILVGGYTIGKERIFKGVAEALDCQVWANSKRQKTWRVLEDEEINSRAKNSTRFKAKVHVVEQRKLTWQGLKAEMQELSGSFDHVLGIKPTGWTHEKGSGHDAELSRLKVQTRGNISLLEVPYSEHSSFSELKRFIQFLRIKDARQIIPTVRSKLNLNTFFTEWIREAAAKGPESQ